MKTLNLVCVLIGISLITGGSSEAIKCYVCDDCKILDDSQLRICSPQDAITPSTTKPNPTTLSTESTTKSSEKPTTESEKPLSEIISTTISPKPTQIITIPPQTDRPIFIETLKPETSTEQIVETNPTSTTSIEEKQTTTTTTTTTSTDLPTNGFPESTEIIYPSEIGPSETFIPTNGIPVSSEIMPEETNSGIQENSPFVSVIPLVPSNSSESMVNLPPAVQAPYNPSVSQISQPYQIFNRVPREVKSMRSGSSFHCYSVDVIDGDTRKTQKGCLEIPEDKAGCEILKDQYGKSVDKCKICTEDKCNSSSTLKLSMISLVMVLIVVSWY